METRKRRKERWADEGKEGEKKGKEVWLVFGD